MWYRKKYEWHSVKHQLLHTANDLTLSIGNNMMEIVKYNYCLRCLQFGLGNSTGVSRPASRAAGRYRLAGRVAALDIYPGATNL